MLDDLPDSGHSALHLSLKKQPFSIMKCHWHSPNTNADVQGNTVGLWKLCSCDQPEEALAYLKEPQEA